MNTIAQAFGGLLVLIGFIVPSGFSTQISGAIILSAALIADAISTRPPKTNP